MVSHNQILSAAAFSNRSSLISAMYSLKMGSTTMRLPRLPTMSYAFLSFTNSRLGATRNVSGAIREGSHVDLAVNTVPPVVVRAVLEDLPKDIQSGPKVGSEAPSAAGGVGLPGDSLDAILRFFPLTTSVEGRDAFFVAALSRGFTRKSCFYCTASDPDFFGAGCFRSYLHSTLKLSWVAVTSPFALMVR